MDFPKRVLLFSRYEVSLITLRCHFEVAVAQNQRIHLLRMFHFSGEKLQQLWKAAVGHLYQTTKKNIQTPSNVSSRDTQFGPHSLCLSILSRSMGNFLGTSRVTQSVFNYLSVIGCHYLKGNCISSTKTTHHPLRQSTSRQRNSYHPTVFVLFFMHIFPLMISK
ncbi:hypothetical protein AVEN_59994-1 [Araneus ventricosus]|uniref:Uncharacterized protein n=1 Tax=Araneus ventricosus TaxID=182803 RepID=A0A4Y2CC58_ARAVE|nr:hypothetical protein AVEN_59994-1 [Araneus ventricosus]